MFSSPQDYGIGPGDWPDAVAVAPDAGCGFCRGSRLDPACTGHPVDGGVLLVCGCPGCGGQEDTPPMISRSARARFAAAVSTVAARAGVRGRAPASPAGAREDRRPPTSALARALMGARDNIGVGRD